MHVAWSRALRSLTAALALVAALPVAASAHGTQVRAAASVAGPDITVVGFGLATARPFGSGLPGAYQLNLTFQVQNPSLSRSLGDLEAMVRHAVVRLEAAGVAPSRILVQGLNLNLNQNTSLQANESVVVNLTTTAQVGKLSDLLSASPGLVGLQNFYLNSGGVGGLTFSQATLDRAYAQAWKSARATALAIAKAEGLVLGAAVSESQGQNTGACGMGGGCPIVNYQGPIGQNQQLETITVTFATTGTAR